MSKQLKAVYENGVFRPLEAVDLAEHEMVTVIVPERVEAARGHSEPNCYELAQRIGLGSIDDLPPDLSTNRDYFEGFGQ